jgi:hypothetical protein
LLPRGAEAFGLFAVIVGLLADANRFGLFFAHAHAHAALRRRDAELAVAELPDQIEGLVWWLFACEPQRVGLDGLLHRFAHLRRGPEESVRRHEPRQRLVRPVEVVVVDEEREPPLAIRVVGEHRAREKLVPQRLPEPLDLPERLRMLWPALHVPDPVASQQLLEGRLTAPCGVLPSLVGEHLVGRPVPRQRALDRLEHELGALVVRERVSHQIARVVVHEADQVQPLVPSQQKREEVRLPHLIRRCSFESTRRLRSALLLRRARLDQPLLVQHAAHRALRHSEPFESRQHVTHAPTARLRLRLLRLDHRLSARVAFECLAARLASARERHQSVQSVRSIAQHPLLDRLRAKPEHLRNLAVAVSALDHLPDHPQPQLHRVHHVRLLAGLASARRPTPSSPSDHLRRSLAGSCPAVGGGWC